MIKRHGFFAGIALAALLLGVNMSCINQDIDDFYDKYIKKKKPAEASDTSDTSDSPDKDKEDKGKSGRKEKQRQVVLDGMYAEDMDNIFGSLTTVAEDAGLNVVEFRKRKMSKREAKNKQLFSISVEGRTVDVSKFLIKLSKDRVAYRVTELKLRMTDPPEVFNECGVDVELAAYKYVVIPHKGIDTEDDVAALLDDERVLTLNLAKAIYEAYKLSKEEDFIFTFVRYNRPGGTIEGEVENSNLVPSFADALKEKDCFSDIGVKEVKSSKVWRDREKESVISFAISFILALP